MHLRGTWKAACWHRHRLAHGSPGSAPPQRRGECRRGCLRRRACTSGRARSPRRGARPPAPPAR
uniref:Uncharacterized protein n=1 Tax=Arundo donax TaxID=35708 RepID=A0A0A9UL61_ARUDO